MTALGMHAGLPLLHELVALPRHLWRQLTLALGDGGMMLATAASFVVADVLCRVAGHGGGVPAGLRRPSPAPPRQGRRRNCASRNLMRTVAGMSSGHIEAKDERQAQDAWTNFQVALNAICPVLDFVAGGIDRLRAACRGDAAFHSLIASAIASFDPLNTAFDAAVAARPAGRAR